MPEIKGLFNISKSTNRAHRSRSGVEECWDHDVGTVGRVRAEGNNVINGLMESRVQKTAQWSKSWQPSQRCERQTDSLPKMSTS